MNEAVDKCNKKEEAVINDNVVFLHRLALSRRVSLEYSQVGIDGHGQIPKSVSRKESS